MSDLIIFMFGTVVMSIFSAGVYIFARIKFNNLENVEIKKHQEEDSVYTQQRTNLRAVDHH